MGTTPGWLEIYNELITRGTNPEGPQVVEDMLSWILELKHDRAALKDQVRTLLKENDDLKMKLAVENK